MSNGAAMTKTTVATTSTTAERVTTADIDSFASRAGRVDRRSTKTGTNVAARTPAEHEVVHHVRRVVGEVEGVGEARATERVGEDDQAG